ncbi:MAG: hypothetical protein ACYDAY_04595 [Candidatus Dormibacteria bacterium]
MTDERAAERDALVPVIPSVGAREVLAVLLLLGAWPVALGLVWSSGRVSARTRFLVTTFLMVPAAGWALLVDTMGIPPHDVLDRGSMLWFLSYPIRPSLADWPFTLAALACLLVGLSSPVVERALHRRWLIATGLVTVASLSGIVLAVIDQLRVNAYSDVEVGGRWMQWGLLGVDQRVQDQGLLLLAGLGACGLGWLAGWFLRAVGPGRAPDRPVGERPGWVVGPGARQGATLVALLVAWPVGLGLLWAGREVSHRVKLAVAAVLMVPMALAVAASAQPHMFGAGFSTQVLSIPIPVADSATAVFYGASFSVTAAVLAVIIAAVAMLSPRKPPVTTAIPLLVSFLVAMTVLTVACAAGLAHVVPVRVGTRIFGQLTLGLNAAAPEIEGAIAWLAAGVIAGGFGIWSLMRNSRLLPRRAP